MAPSLLAVWRLVFVPVDLAPCQFSCSLDLIALSQELVVLVRLACVTSASSRLLAPSLLRDPDTALTAPPALRSPNGARLRAK